MPLTNHAGLPAPMVRAMAFRERDPLPNVFHATELQKPSREVALHRKYGKLIEEDASDRLYALMGSAGHMVLEMASGRDPRPVIQDLSEVAISDLSQAERYERAEAIMGRYVAACEFTERTMRAEFVVDGVKVTLRGTYDLTVAEQAGRFLTDYKYTSLYAAMGPPKPEWVAQQNIYRRLDSLQDRPMNITGARVVAIFRDWSKIKATVDPNYPCKTQVKVFDLPLWTLEETDAYIRARISSHLAAIRELDEAIESGNPGAFVVACTGEERWERGEKFAVHVVEGKRAVRGGLQDTMAGALAMVERLDAEADAKAAGKKKKTTPKRHEVRHRPGLSLKCAYYCGARSVCALRSLYVPADLPDEGDESDEETAADAA